MTKPRQRTWRLKPALTRWAPALPQDLQCLTALPAPILGPAAERCGPSLVGRAIGFCWILNNDTRTPRRPAPPPPAARRAATPKLAPRRADENQHAPRPVDSATFSRRGSASNPDDASARANETTTQAASLPWKRSTASSSDVDGRRRFSARS